MENNNDIQLIKIEAVVREEMFVDVKKGSHGYRRKRNYSVSGCRLRNSAWYVGVCKRTEG